jgi:hypothetical protein
MAKKILVFNQVDFQISLLLLRQHFDAANLLFYFRHM